jgi:Domain of unknown function (DUF5666)/Domain of unknown function (DUF4382)
MLRKSLLVALVLTALFFTSCGGGSSSSTPTPTPTPTPAGSTLFNLTIQDTPPAGVTILSFEVTVTGAVLHRGTTDVSILSVPVKVEITQLETESALLSTKSVTSGQYDSITVTFANPEMTIMNNSAMTMAGCAAGAICKMEMPQIGLSSASVDFAGPPFPLSLTKDTSTGLLLDFNLASSVQNDLSINPTIGFTKLAVVDDAKESELEGLEDLNGRVSALGTNQFTLQVTSSGQSFTILVDSNTKFEDFGEEELSEDFSSLRVDQVVEVNAKLNGDGSMLATKVELKEPEKGEEIEGTITSVDSSLTKFDMVVLDEIPDIAGVQVGDKVTVDVTSATYRIDNEELNISSDLSFATAADLVAGQTVEVSRGSDSSGTAIVADRVRLQTSQFTAHVESVSDSSFLVNNLPDLFTAAGITEIQVRTSSGTEFDDVSGVSALSAGDKLALRGLLFNVTGTPVLVAKKVRKL